MFMRDATKSESRPRVAAVRVEDETLVQRVRLGDRSAFDLLYLRYARFIAGIAYRLLGDNSEVDEVVQDTFVALFEGVDRLREPSKVKSWLAIVATRQVRRRLARRTRQRQVTKLAHGPWTATSSDPRQRDAVDALYDALDTVPPKLRVPWIVYRIEGQSLEDTARRCGVSLATVKRRIRNAESRLQRRLGHG